MFQQLHRSPCTKVFLFALIGLFGFVGQTWALSFAYVANIGDDIISAYTIVAGTEVLTPVPGSPFATRSAPYFVTVSPDPALALAAVSIPTLSSIGCILLVLALMVAAAVQRRRYTC